MPFYDAHNHLQDERLASDLPSIMQELRGVGLRRCVCNGTQPSDWPRVATLAEQYPEIIPSFGLHPWYVKEAPPDWKKLLGDYLDRYPFAIGEIGLDRWIKDFDWELQLDAFTFQVQLASERGLPVSIHCLKAWGPLLDVLKQIELPGGFLLHSYGGSEEMIHEFVKLGGRFSLSGYFAHERKAAQSEVFKRIPPNLLLLETDAPDMLGPEALGEFQLEDHRCNHPGNIRAVYRFAAGLLGMTQDELNLRSEENFNNLFGRT